MALLQPNAGDLHVNKMLTNISIGYTNPTFIADEIFPLVTVGKQTDIIPEYNQDFWFRDEGDALMIGDGGVAADVGFAVTKTDMYYCDKFGARHFVSNDQRANQDDPFDMDRDATEFVTNLLQLQREVSFVTDFWKTSVWTTDVTGGSTVTKWSDFGASDPIVDIRTYKRTVRRLIGRDPNVLVLGDLTYDKLVDHPDVLDRIKYTERGIATSALLAALFDVQKVLVGKSIRVSTLEGASSHTYTANWDDDALLLYVPPSPSLFTPSAGYTFAWKTGDQAGGGMQWMRKYHDEERIGDFIEVRSYYDQKLTVAGAGAFFTDIVD